MLAAAVPAFAQTGPASPPPENGAGGWAGEKFERQEFREEMEQIRKEHEELEAARDRLRDKCEHAGNQQAAECEKERQALHEWHDRLHERMRVLHEKIEAERKEHPEQKDGATETPSAR